MKRALPLMALSAVIAGCGGGGAKSGTAASLMRPSMVAKAESGPVRTVEVPWHGAMVLANDPGNSDFSSTPCKFPQMPLLPTGDGPLRKLVFVLDPGHGGEDPGAYWIENILGKPTTFWESAYSYPITYTLADKLRQKGATVYLTAFSELSLKAAEAQTSPDDPLPVPRDAALAWNGKSVVPGKPGWWQRIHMANDVYKRLSKQKKVVMLSVHVDSMPSEGWKGSHVLVKDKNNPPLIAEELADELRAGGYERTQWGEPRPVIDRTRSLFIFRKTKNPNTILWETALPQNEDDSIRIRDKESREQYADVMVEAAEEFASQ